MSKWDNLLSQIKYDDKGLLSCIVQDVENNEILMFAFMNDESLKLTLETGFATYWSRSRKKLWIKGESSGHKQEVKEIYYDCDADCLLIKIVQKVAACHEGYRTCFFRKIENDGSIKIIGEKLFDESATYKK